MTEKEYLERAEVARIFSVSPDTITRWAREGRLPSVQTLGGRHRFLREEVLRLARELNLRPIELIPPREGTA